MKLPNGDHAVAEIEKFCDYCLNSEHPAGKHKARVFKAAVGFTQVDAGRLREMALEAARAQEAIAGPLLPLYGQTYVVDFAVRGFAAR